MHVVLNFTLIAVRRHSRWRY